MKIEVTAEDIAYGKRNDCAHCPIALAATRKTGIDCLVAHSAIFVGAVIVRMPKKAQEWLVDFDAGRPVSPFDFCVEVQAQQERLEP